MFYSLHRLHRLVVQFSLAFSPHLRAALISYTIGLETHALSALLQSSASGLGGLCATLPRHRHKSLWRASQKLLSDVNLYTSSDEDSEPQTQKGSHSNITKLQIAFVVPHISKRSFSSDTRPMQSFYTATPHPFAVTQGEPR